MKYAMPDSDFFPGDYVTVLFLGLHYPGRVETTILTRSGKYLYKVVYADDRGEIKNESFSADEITLKIEPTPVRFP